uniref:MORF/ORRM1/DAG-like MORF domain-containing protein n=1 Tax=Oryza meridionalis TaxID=40149 RepID=A0A0E0DHX3_9ORYZ
MLSPALERKLSIQSDHRRTRDDAVPVPVPVPVVKPIASFSPSLHASERSSRLRTQGATRRRDGRHGQDNYRLLARVALNRSARTTVPPPAPRPRQSPERRLDRLASRRSSRAVTPRRGTVDGGNPLSDMRCPRRGDHSSTERGGSSRPRSLSREPSSAVQERGRGLHCGASPAAAPRVGAEGGSLTRRLGRLDSGLSVNLVPPRHGSQRGGRGAATTTKLSSSTDAAATIRSSIRPSSREFMERSPRRAGEAENDRKEGADAASVSKGRPSRGELSSMERGSGSGRSLSREPSSAVQERGRGLHRGASPPAAVRVGAEGSSTRRLERLDSGLSASMVSRRGTLRAGRGASTLELSSSTDAAATTRSRIRPNRDLTERSLLQAGEADEDESLRRRRGKGKGKGKEKADDDAASVSIGRPSRPPRRALNRINSGSTYSSNSCPPEPTSSTSGSTLSWVPPRDNAPSWAPPPPRGNAPSWVPPPPQPRGIAPPEYGFQVSGASRVSRHLRRQERLERRVERMRRFKEKLGTVFHHLHHHHYFGPSGSNEGAPPLFSRDVHGNGYHRPSPWKVLGGVLHRATRRGEKKTRSVPADQRGGVGCGGGVGHALLHMWDKRRAMAKQRGGVGRALFQMWGKRRAAAKQRGGGVGRALFQMWVKRWATAKRRGGGGVAHALFHVWGKRRATASAGMCGTGSRWKAKKLHWWQRVRPRHPMATAAAAARAVAAAGRPAQGVPLSRRLTTASSSSARPLRPRGGRAAGSVRCMARRPESSYSPLRSGQGGDRAPTEMAPLFPGCDYEHWLIVMDKPGGEGATKQQMIDCYIQTLAKVVGSEEEAKKKIYNVSCERYFGFGCEIDEETSNKLEGLPGVLFVLPDSYVDAENKDYGAELFVNGEIVQRSPERQRRVEPVPQRAQDRPRYSDRTRYVKRRENQAYQRIAPDFRFTLDLTFPPPPAEDAS